MGRGTAHPFVFDWSGRPTVTQILRDAFNLVTVFLRLWRAKNSHKYVAVGTEACITLSKVSLYVAFADLEVGQHFVWRDTMAA